MATTEKLPFSWQAVEGLPDLDRLRLVLDTLPDEEIVAALEAGLSVRTLFEDAPITLFDGL